MNRMRRRPKTSFHKALLAFAILLLCALLYGLWAMAAPKQTDALVLITIQPGDSVQKIARTLNDNGLIRNPTAFIASAYLSGKWRRLQAGRHELEGDMSGFVILDALSRGTNTSWRWLTIPEGFSVRQIADRLEQSQLGRREVFLQLAADTDSFNPAFPLPMGSLEGYLFPDTYRIDSGQTERDIIEQMLRRFNEVVWKGILDGKGAPDGRSPHEVIILASLVEWEAQWEEERPVIAGVLINRLNIGMRLQCDATVQYALGENRKSRLTYADLTVESDYNTYLHAGLPPGPICNPGEESIRAALYPAEVTYLYYVAKDDGSHIFSNNYDEHRRAITLIRSAR